MALLIFINQYESFVYYAPDDRHTQVARLCSRTPISHKTLTILANNLLNNSHCLNIVINRYQTVI